MKTLITTEVLVVGGGPAGIGAAIASARRGAKLRDALRADGVDLDRASETSEYPKSASFHWRDGENWNR